MITRINDFKAELIGKENMFFNIDCMELLKKMPDNSISLAIVDPPYGMNATNRRLDKTNRYVNLWGGTRENKIVMKGGSNGSLCKQKAYHPFDDSSPPNIEYFRELERVSEHRIIWGGNFLWEFLGKTSCMIVWDKGRRNMRQADCEIAWTDFPEQSRVFEWLWNGMLQQDMKNKEKRIHPTQKPVALYRWLIERFAKDGDVILDTHVGSASSLIACHQTGHKFIGAEIDAVYYEDAKERFEAETAQASLFDLIKT